MSAARAGLAAVAAAAGYGPETLTVIADAALPLHRPGARLDETQLGHIATAVEVLAQCGYAAGDLPELIADYRDRYGELCWRTPFWRNQLRAATLRYRRPRFYGLSPCEADPARLAGSGEPNDPAIAPLAHAA